LPGSLFRITSTPGAQTVHDAIHLADGRRNSVLNRVDGKGELVERPLTMPSTREAWTWARLLTSRTNPPTWSALLRSVALGRSGFR
jgi:hypothetical protein